MVYVEPALQALMHPAPLCQSTWPGGQQEGSHGASMVAVQGSPRALSGRPATAPAPAPLRLTTTVPPGPRLAFHITDVFFFLFSGAAADEEDEEKVTGTSCSQRPSWLLKDAFTLDLRSPGATSDDESPDTTRTVGPWS